MKALVAPVVENAKLMAKGQITLPKDIRTALGLRTGDRVTLIQQENRVVLMNSAVYAMGLLQQAMEGQAQAAGLHTEEEVAALLSHMRGA